MPEPIQPRFYNSLTHRPELFEPVEPTGPDGSRPVSMYNCGPTVYDFAHIGNFKTFVFADVLRRTLELLGYDVTQVMNLTDVGHMTDDAMADGGGEDKMQVAAERLAAAKKMGDAHAVAIDDPSDPYQIAAFYIDAFLEDARALRLKVADDPEKHRPRATQYVADAMVPMIERLIESGHAYVADTDEGDGAVYFSVESFPEYGRLSGNTIEQLKGGAGGRVQAKNQLIKRHPADFLLFKPDASHLMKWDSPWGPGYPGWHIECSAMAKAVHGKDVIDIHTGGEDNIFPHHECEIAQSCGANGTESFARLWMHSRHLMVEGEKMSKSLGNFYTVRDVLSGKVTGRPVDPAVLRFELLKAKYRSTMNFTKQSLLDSGGAVKKLRDAWAAWGGNDASQVEPIGLEHEATRRFAEALADDLNTAGAIGVAFEYLAGQHGQPDDDRATSLGVLATFDAVLDVIGEAAAEPSDAFDADALAAELDAARANKRYDDADAIRQRLIDAGYEVKTTKDGTVASKALA
ncbi:MAG: cysteine--tRNA ligase [Planctomycetota bacterium]